MHRRASADLRYRVGDNLAALRRARGLNQLELAARCGCHHHVISNIENGRRNTTLATLEMLASALNCCESDLLRRWPVRPVHAGPTGTRDPSVCSSLQKEPSDVDSQPPPE